MMSPQELWIRKLSSHDFDRLVRFVIEKIYIKVTLETGVNP